MSAYPDADLGSTGREIRLESAAGVAWVKDADRTILVGEDGHENRTLVGVEAVIWDLFCLGYPFEQAVRLTVVLLGLKGEDAADLLRSTAEAWAEAGWLRSVAGQAGAACCVAGQGPAEGPGG